MILEKIFIGFIVVMIFCSIKNRKNLKQDFINVMTRRR